MAIFFGEKSVHSLLSQPLYNGHLSTIATLIYPKVAVVDKVNCILLAWWWKSQLQSMEFSLLNKTPTIPTEFQLRH